MEFFFFFAGRRGGVREVRPISGTLKSYGIFFYFWPGGRTEFFFYFCWGRTLKSYGIFFISGAGTQNFFSEVVWNSWDHGNFGEGCEVVYMVVVHRVVARGGGYPGNGWYPLCRAMEGPPVVWVRVRLHRPFVWVRIFRLLNRIQHPGAG